MSNLAYARPQPIGRPREEQPLVAVPRRVRVVTTRAQRRARPKLVYALGATGVIFAIFLTQLFITIALSSGAYKIDGLQTATQGLGRTANSLNERLNTLGSTQNLAANAKALGMVGSGKAAFLRLSTGQVLGSASPAGHASALTGASGAADSVANSLLTNIPVISNPDALTSSTGTGHGDTNTVNSTSGTTESTQGQLAPSQTGTTTPASPPSPAVNPGDLPSPVTH